MVDTMNTESVATVVAPIPPTNNNEALLEQIEETQKQIVAGLLRQRPTIVQAAVSGSPSPININEIEYANIVQTIQALGGPASLTSLKAITKLLEPCIINPVPMLISEESRPSASSSPSSTTTAISNSGASNSTTTSNSAEPEYKPRNVREKVYADGYIMSFDKKSCCGTKYFWRCERKNDCNARMHSDIETREIVRKLHPHNHEKPSPEELAFYEQDFSTLSANYCHPVKSINRSYMQRKLSRASHAISQMPQAGPAPPPVPQQPILPEPMEVDTNNQIQQNNNLMLLASLNAAAVAAAASLNSPAIGQKRMASTVTPIKLKSPRTIKKEDDESVFSELISDEEFRTTYEITKKLMELMKPKTEIGVRWQGDEESLLLFLSHDNGALENVFFPVVVMNRDEKSLITAIEGFTGKRCEGKIALSYSRKVNVLVHEALISNWTHGKLFIVNSNSANLWRLTPVDAFGEPLKHV